MEEPEQLERIYCVDADSGKVLWRHQYDAEYEIQYRAGPRAAVTIDGSRAFALGAMGHLHCLQAANGQVIWKKDLRTEYKVDVPAFGIAAAPLIFGNLLIVQVGGADGATVVAFDKTTGTEKWAGVAGGDFLFLSDHHRAGKT